MRLLTVIGKFAASVIVAALLTGWAQVVSGDAQKVSINTGFLGKYAPGTREWLSWLQASDHCAMHSKVPAIVDLKGSLALYRCVADK